MIYLKQIEVVFEQNMTPEGDDVFAGISVDKRKELIVSYIAAAKKLTGGEIYWRQHDETPEVAVNRMVSIAAATINKAGKVLRIRDEDGTHKIDEHGNSAPLGVTMKSVQVFEVCGGQTVSVFLGVPQPRGFVGADDYADALIMAFRGDSAEPMTIRDVLAPRLG